MLIYGLKSWPTIRRYIDKRIYIYTDRHTYIISYHIVSYHNSGYVQLTHKMIDCLLLLLLLLLLIASFIERLHVCMCVCEGDRVRVRAL